MTQFPSFESWMTAAHDQDDWQRLFQEASNEKRVVTDRLMFHDETPF